MTALFPPRLMREEPVAGLPGDCASVDGAAVVTYPAAGAGIAHAIGGVAWSYSAAPTGGNLTIADGATTIFSVDITAAGAGFFLFRAPRMGSPDTAMTITLADGGGAIVGKVSVTEHFLVPGASVLYGLDFSDPANSGYLLLVL